MWGQYWSRDMMKWPDGIKCAVLLTFDLDAETLWTSRNEESWKSPRILSCGTYGINEGVPRILKLLDKWNIKSTFFIPGWVIEKHEETVKEINKRGHEIAYHGYLHECNVNITWEEDVRLIEKCENIIKKITGTRPVGQRSPMGEMPAHTIKMLHERGYMYTSNMMDRDIPYFHRQEGKEIDLVELPTDCLYDDTSHYFFTLQSPPRRPIASPSTLLEIWKGEFDGLYEEEKYLNLIIHPQCSGRVSRVKALDELISHMKSKEGTWIGRADKVAEFVFKNINN
jgi:peptidoglycan-N-acetylglucosamine deacetylase